uniref:Uncharacterized protein n=1 Tax=Tetradesmus obliquus TaxID=3088 RepID=A0A383WAD7_TETOB|eukprot:jgi/Sobl393_1/19502/SZX74162.1
MIQLYRLSEQQAQAAAAVGVDDIERRQHVHQLTHKILQGCRQASLPFSWLRACGLRAVAEALSTGLQDGAALAAVLEATYSQVLEVILSTLDRDLMPPTPPAPTLPPLPTTAAGAAAAGGSSSSSSALSSSEQSALLEAVGRYPAGHAPAAACSEELCEAYRVLQALVLLHAKSRSLLTSAQYLQLLTARACEVPACLPHALHTLLALLQGNEEAQAMFVSTGGCDMLLARTLQHTQQMAAVGEAAGSGAPPDLLLQLLLFLQTLLGWGIGESVRRGAHPSTQRAAVQLMLRHLGPEAAKLLTQGLAQLVAAAGAAGPAGHVTAEAAAAAGGGGGEGGGADMAVGGGLVAIEAVLQQRARAAAALMPRT